MANVYKNIQAQVTSAGSFDDMYTAPAETTSIGKTIKLFNTHGSSLDVLIKVYDASGTTDYDDVIPLAIANEYLANDVALANESVASIPIHQKNTNFTLKAFSDSPFPVSLSAMMWEGYYSPRFYRRA